MTDELPGVPAEDPVSTNGDVPQDAETAPDVEQPQPISVTDFYLINFTRVHAIFKSAFGKTTVKPEFQFALVDAAAKYAASFTQIELQMQQQQRASQQQ